MGTCLYDYLFIKYVLYIYIYIYIYTYIIYKTYGNSLKLIPPSPPPPTYDKGHADAHSCSNVAKKIFFFQIKLLIQNKYLYPLSKNLILLKRNSLCKEIHSVKQTYSVKGEFYFLFSFATNEQV